MQQPNDRAAGLMRIGPAASGRTMPWPSGPSRSRPHGGGELRVDICVIGAGSGGLSVAAAAAQLGVSVALIEKHKMGGDCLNYGCVPSKALIAAARRAHLMRTCAPFGIVPTNPTVSYKGVHDHVQGVIAAIAPNNSAERFAGLGVKVIRAAAQFISRDTVVAGDSASRRAASSSPPARRRPSRPSPASTACPISPTRPSSRTARSSTTSSSSAAARSASSWPRRICASAAASPCSRP